MLLASRLMSDSRTHPAAHTTRGPLLEPFSYDPCKAISTRKEWTIPPRPKPGRKPALEGAPTKRKAQNRQAQRAFRERRAAKVGELEEQMKAMEEEDAKEQQQLSGIITRLKRDLMASRELLEFYKRKCAEIQGQWEAERQANKRLPLEIPGSGDDRCYSTNATFSPLRTTPKLEETLIGRSQGVEVQADEAAEVTCGRCTNDTRCKCIDEAFEVAQLATEDDKDSGTEGSPSLKHSHSPIDLAAGSNKRICQENEADEIDFTVVFSRSNPQSSNVSSSVVEPAIATGDQCGFCDDSTACVCAEIYHKEQISKDLDTTVLSNSCTNDPGSCTQCQGDPRSTLFCKSLASSHPDAPPAGISSEAKQIRVPAATSTTGPTLTCADTFTTLARHPAFSQATTDLGAWVPQLATRSVPTTTGGDLKTQGRTAFEIEAASVMSVIKFFDRTYGDEGRGISHAEG